MVCRHRWRVGSGIAKLTGKNIEVIGRNIWCEKCDKKITAYYKHDASGRLDA